jgi:hypothetical protein
MSAGTEIMITIRPGDTGIGGTQQGEAADAPSPRPDMTEAFAVTRGEGEAPPAPIDAMGAAGLDTGAAPAPTEGATSGAAAASALPEPVPLEEIEQLGSLEGTASGQEDVPEPQGDAE